MGWFRQWLEKRGRAADAHKVQNDVLVDEIWQAHKDWVVAQRKLDYALDKDQIDYAIYITEAAEKRYDMLIRQAKTGYTARLRKQEEAHIGKQAVSLGRIGNGRGRGRWNRDG